MNENKNGSKAGISALRGSEQIAVFLLGGDDCFKVDIDLVARDIQSLDSTLQSCIRSCHPKTYLRCQSDYDFSNGGRPTMVCGLILSLFVGCDDQPRLLCPSGRQWIMVNKSKTILPSAKGAPFVPCPPLRPINLK